MSECNEQCLIGKRVYCDCRQNFCFRHPKDHINICRYSHAAYLEAKKNHLNDIETRLIDTLDYIYTQIDTVSSNLFNQIKILKQKLESCTLTINQGYNLELNSIGKFDVEEFDPIVVKYNTEHLCASFISKGTAIKLNKSQEIKKIRYEDKIYVGSPINGQLSGLFEVSSIDLQYNGHVVDGICHGFGYLNAKNQYRYIGGWFQGKKDGYGICEWVVNNGMSKSWYKGNFLNGVIHGYGELYYSDGSMYLGQWYNEKKHGQGKMIYLDGKIYTGNFENDDVNGFGKKVYPHGEIYEGWFEKNVRSGEGTLTRTNGRVYKGNFVNNRMVGEFTVTLPNREAVYKGPIVNEMLNGVGTIRVQNINADQQVLFVNDEICRG